MGTVGTMASQVIEVVTLVFLNLLAHHTCQCKDLEERLEETAGIKRENARMEAFEDQLNQLSSQFEMRVAEMKEELAAKQAEMNERLEAEVATVRKEVDQLRDVPDLIQCAYQDYLGESDEHTFVTFDRLITDYNINNPGSFDLDTGRFEAAITGFYTVTYSASAVLLM